MAYKGDGRRPRAARLTERKKRGVSHQEMPHAGNSDPPTPREPLRTPGSRTSPSTAWKAISRFASSCATNRGGRRLEFGNMYRGFENILV